MRNTLLAILLTIPLLATSVFAATGPVPAGVYHCKGTVKQPARLFLTFRDSEPRMLMLVEIYSEDFSDTITTEYAVTLVPGASAGMFSARYTLRGTWGLPDQSVLPERLYLARQHNGTTMLRTDSNRHFKRITPAKLIFNGMFDYEGCNEIHFANTVPQSDEFILVTRLKDGNVGFTLRSGDDKPVTLANPEYSVELDRARYTECPNNHQRLSVLTKKPDGSQVWLLFDVESSPITRAGLRLTTEAPFPGFGVRYWNCDPDKVLAATGPAGSNMRLQTFRSGDPLYSSKKFLYRFYSPEFPDGIPLRQTRHNPGTPSGYTRRLLRRDGSQFALMRIHGDQKYDFSKVTLRFGDNREIIFESPSQEK